MIVLTLARKPPIGSVARNSLVYGTGGINIDACRVGFASDADMAESVNKNQHGKWNSNDGVRSPTQAGIYNGDYRPPRDYEADKGRFPANVILSHREGCQLLGVQEVKENRTDPRRACEEGCPVAELDVQSIEGGMHSAGAARDKIVLKSEYNATSYCLVGGANNMRRLGDSGGASRFFKHFGDQK